MSATNTVDPVEDQIRRLDDVTRQLTALLRDPAVARRLRAIPGEADWSATQILGHMVEMIPFWLGECRRLIDAAEPPRLGRELDQPERLAGVEHGAHGDVEELLRQWQANVATAAETVRSMSPAERAKTGTHLRRGAMSVADVVSLLIVAHAEDHLKQMHAALQG